MENKNIAAILLDRRNSLAPVVMQGEMRSKLGSDGYQEALRLGWLRPNMDTGELTITDQFCHLDSMRRMKEAEEPKIGDQVMVSDEGKPFNATIQSVKPDGTLVLSFGDERPKAVRSYKKDEVRVVKPSQASSTVPQNQNLNATKQTVATLGSAVTSAGSPPVSSTRP